MEEMERRVQRRTLVITRAAFWERPIAVMALRTAKMIVWPLGAPS